MRQAICSYASRAAEKLRGEHQYCRHISVFVKTSPFALNERYYGNCVSVKLLTPTQDSRDIITAAVRCTLSRRHMTGWASLSKGWSNAW